MGRIGAGSLKWLGVALAAGLGLSLLAMTSCNDDSGDMAQQITRTTPGGAKNTPDIKSPAGAPGAKATAGGKSGATPASAATEEVPQPKVTVKVVEIKAPFAEFTGPGRYDIKVTAVLDAYQDPAVWRISAVDKAGTSVGEQQLYLKIPIDVPRVFIFNEFFCKSMPDSVKFELTDVKAVQATATEGGQPGAGTAGGAGASGAGAAGRGGGAGGAGGGAGGGDKGGAGGGDKGGGDEGGDGGAGGDSGAE